MNNAREYSKRTILLILILWIAVIAILWVYEDSQRSPVCYKATGSVVDCELFYNLRNR